MLIHNQSRNGFIKPYKNPIKRALKRFRSSQPFNYLATSATHGLFKLTRQHSEFVIKHLHRVGDVQSELPNGRRLRLWSRADDWVSNQVFWRGWSGYEPETIPLFFRLATKAQATFDVGAYVGYYTLLAGHANPKGRVFAFEPLPDNYARLLKNVERNGFTNAHCINVAVGDSEGEANFYSMPGGMQCSSSMSYEFMKSTGEPEILRVPVITLDEFVRENAIDRVDLVKIDTESTEPQVLLGMMKTLRRDKPFIICEVLGRGSEKPLEELLAPLGYQYYHLTPDGPVLCNAIKGHPEWLNYLFTPLDPDEIAGI
jgi:FkbM family methyltransferase